MWEVTHFHRALRPRAAEMLEGLKALGLKLGIVSNTAALYQVFAVLKESPRSWSSWRRSAAR